MGGASRHFLLIALLICFAARVAPAQSITREYPIDDFMPLQEPGAATFNQRPPPTTAQIDDGIARLIQIIENEVAPESWKDRGGNLGSIERRERKFAITQSSQNHDALAQLIKLRQMQITLETRCITGSAIEDWARDQGGTWVEQNEDVKIWPTPLISRQVDEILKLVQTRLDGTIITAPRLTMFNRQRATVTVATDTAYVKSVTPVTGRDGSIAFDPNIGKISSGVTLECTPESTLEAESAKLTLNLQLIKLLGFGQLPVNAVGKDGPIGAIVQVPNVVTTSIDQVITVPSDKAVLLRATPKRTLVDPNAPAPDPIYVLIRAKIITPEKQP